MVINDSDFEYFVGKLAEMSRNKAHYLNMMSAGGGNVLLDAQDAFDEHRTLLQRLASATAMMQFKSDEHHKIAQHLADMTETGRLLDMLRR